MQVGNNNTPASPPGSIAGAEDYRPPVKLVEGQAVVAAGQERMTDSPLQKNTQERQVASDQSDTARMMGRYASEEVKSHISQFKNLFVKKYLERPECQEYMSIGVKTLDLLRGGLDASQAMQLPAEAPSFPKLEILMESEGDADDKRQFREIFLQYLQIYSLVSCINLDQIFVEKLARHVQGNQCLEIYAGNGWLSDELRKFGVSIRATDDLSYFQQGVFYEVFKRDVDKADALEAAKQFASEVPGGKIIIMGSPQRMEGDSNLTVLFELVVQYPELKIISIDLFDYQSAVPVGVQALDITDQLEYACGIGGERVIEFSRSAS